METVHDIMIRKLRGHTALSREEIAHLRSLPATPRSAKADEDLVCQGDEPDASIVVLRGMLARYHTLGEGDRQYLSFHIAGDWPDAQALFVQKMDHSLCAICDAEVAMIKHKHLLALFDHVPALGAAVWRETLIDAAIFREAITNNSKREITKRIAHFLCEQYYRSKAAGLADGDNCELPISQTQMADALASSLTTINRGLQKLRRTRAFEFERGRLKITNWQRLSRYGDFDPSYLHMRQQPRPL